MVTENIEMDRLLLRLLRLWRREDLGPYARICSDPETMRYTFGGEHTGDLRGMEAVLGMLRDASERTGGTCHLVPREVVSNGEHAVAMIDWSAQRGDERLEGKEVAVYRTRGGKVVEASFHQDDVDLDRRFWE